MACVASLGSTRKELCTEARSQFVMRSSAIQPIRPPKGGPSDKPALTSSLIAHPWVDPFPQLPQVDWARPWAHVKIPGGNYSSVYATSFDGKTQSPSHMYPIMQRAKEARNVRYLQAPYQPDGQEFFPGKRLTSSGTTYSILSSAEAAMLADANQRYADRMNSTSAATASRVSTVSLGVTPDEWQTSHRKDYFLRPISHMYNPQRDSPFKSINQPMRSSTAPMGLNSCGEDLTTRKASKRPWKSRPFVSSQPSTTSHEAAVRSKSDHSAVFASLLPVIILSLVKPVLHTPAFGNTVEPCTLVSENPCIKSLLSCRRKKVGILRLSTRSLACLLPRVNPGQSK